jgi:hypothetical protein
MVAGQIGPKQNQPQSKRPQVKSAPDQIIVLLWSILLFHSFFFTPGNHMSAMYMEEICIIYMQTLKFYRQDY